MGTSIFGACSLGDHHVHQQVCDPHPGRAGPMDDDSLVAQPLAQRPHRRQHRCGHDGGRSLHVIVERAGSIPVGLQDAVAANDKKQARRDTREWLNSGHRAWVRINDAASDFWNDDCDALGRTEGLEGIMLAKSESASHIYDTADRLPDGTRILALVETARGLQHVEQIASASSTFRIAFGTGYTASIAGPTWLFYARSFPEPQRGVGAITKSSIRLSIGVEEPSLLIEDLDHALREV